MDDQLRNYSKDHTALKQEFEVLELETIDKMHKMKANCRILNGQIQSVTLFDHRPNTESTIS